MIIILFLMLDFSQLLLQKNFKHLLCPSSTVLQAIKTPLLSGHKRMLQVHFFVLFCFVPAQDTESVMPNGIFFFFFLTGKHFQDVNLGVKQKTPAAVGSLLIKLDLEKIYF